MRRGGLYSRVCSAGVRGIFQALVVDLRGIEPGIVCTGGIGFGKLGERLSGEIVAPEVAVLLPKFP
jgi:hypothetical protein